MVARVACYHVWMLVSKGRPYANIVNIKTKSKTLTSCKNNRKGVFLGKVWLGLIQDAGSEGRMLGGGGFGSVSRVPSGLVTHNLEKEKLRYTKRWVILQVVTRKVFSVREVPFPLSPWYRVQRIPSFGFLKKGERGRGKGEGSILLKLPPSPNR